MTLQVSHSEFGAEFGTEFGAGFGPGAVPILLVDAARCWRAARDNGDQSQPRLSDMLAAHDCAMLAPVLDSLCLFYETELGRPMAIGQVTTDGARALSADERRLLGLIDGTIARHCAECPDGTASPLDCAVCSTRIMLALTVGQRGLRTLQ
jgi:hypothetical protein